MTDLERQAREVLEAAWRIQPNDVMDPEALERWRSIPFGRDFSANNTSVRRMVALIDYLASQRAFRAAQPGEGEEPVTVPRYPTDEMMNAGLYHCSADMTWADLFTAWQAMFDTLSLDGGTTGSLPAALAKPRPDREAVAIIWRAAMTAACNIAIDEQNRENDDDAPSRVLEAQGEIIRRIKGILEIDEDYRQQLAALLPAEPVQEMREVDLLKEITDAMHEAGRVDVKLARGIRDRLRASLLLSEDGWREELND